MKSLVLRAMLLAAAIALLGGCAVQERDPRDAVRDAMKNDTRACGTDTNCLRKREAARSRGAPATQSTPSSP
jgi:hypothetical protein